jgi:hypothetical protein
MVTLRNGSRRIQVFNLPHEQYCADDECYCETREQQQRILDPQTGDYGMASLEKRIPGSITFLGGETKGDLPDSILACPDIKAALARTEDRLIKVLD